MRDERDAKPEQGSNALLDGADANDPWIACLLGCISFSQSFERGLRERRPRPEAPPADLSDPTLAWWLGIVALSERFRRQVASVEPSPATASPKPRPPRGGLLR